MTIERGASWGSARPLPDDGVIARSDADAAAAVASARARGVGIPSVGLLAGDLCRTVGGNGDERRLQSADAVTLPVDIAEVELDGGPHVFLAHVVARRSWWHGRVWIAMNAEWLGDWDVAPRAHPGDGLLDVFDVTLSLRDRIKARRRVRTGTHVPHPDIAQTRATSAHAEFDEALSACGSMVNASETRHRSRSASRARSSTSWSRFLRMYAWILDESPGSYRWGEMPDPEPGPDDVVVSVVASALNHMDLWLTRGMPKPTLPHIPGCDVAGIVHAVGDCRHERRGR